MQWRDLALVAAGGAIGSALRYTAGRLVGPTADAVFPWHTFLVNITGAFLLGFLVAFAGRHGWPAWWRPFVAAGILGGYTTFSTFSLEIVELGLKGQVALSAVYAASSLGAGVLGCLGGVVLARSL